MFRNELLLHGTYKLFLQTPARPRALASQIACWNYCSVSTIALADPQDGTPLRSTRFLQHGQSPERLVQKANFPHHTTTARLSVPVPQMACCHSFRSTAHTFAEPKIVTVFTPARLCQYGQAAERLPHEIQFQLVLQKRVRAEVTFDPATAHGRPMVGAGCVAVRVHRHTTSGEDGGYPACQEILGGSRGHYTHVPPSTCSSPRGSHVGLRNQQVHDTPSSARFGLAIAKDEPCPRPRRAESQFVFSTK
jgi:hypothetical protein